MFYQTLTDKILFFEMKSKLFIGSQNIQVCMALSDEMAEDLEEVEQLAEQAKNHLRTDDRGEVDDCLDEIIELADAWQ